jgi:hypothetical protein
MSKQTTKTSGNETAQVRGDHALDRQYGSIGISAVAAALPYCGSAKKPAHGVTREASDRDSKSKAHSVLAV